MPRLAPSRRAAQELSVDRHGRVHRFPYAHSARFVGGLALGVLAIAMSYAALALPGDVVDVLVEEDGPFETLGAIGLFVAGVVFVVAGRRAGGTSGSRLRQVVLIGMGVGLVFAAGEEISWGQRIFGIETPEGLDSTQNETNLHNLAPLQGKLDIVFQLFWMVGFIVIPIAARVSPRVRETIGRVFPIAPVAVAMLFLAAYVFAQVAVKIFGRSGASYDSTYPVVHSVTEIKEAVVGVLLAVAAIVIARSSALRRHLTAST